MRWQVILGVPNFRNLKNECRLCDYGLVLHDLFCDLSKNSICVLCIGILSCTSIVDPASKRKSRVWNTDRNRKTFFWTIFDHFSFVDNLGVNLLKSIFKKLCLYLTVHAVVCWCVWHFDDPIIPSVTLRSLKKYLGGVQLNVNQCRKHTEKNRHHRKYLHGKFSDSI